MIIDLHVHVSAFTPGHGSMSRKLLDSIPFRFMRLVFGMRGEDERTEKLIENRLAKTLNQTRELDAAVILAFDAVFARDGTPDPANTHLYVTNDYVIELCRRHPKMLFGASVHPYRKDAVRELERSIAAGAVLLKWLPIVQGFSPADPECIPIYELLAHHGIPLLSHTGGERSLPSLRPDVADPRLLLPALERGVTVIAAHCGTRSWPGERDYTEQFAQMARGYERCYGDTAALNLPMRWHGWKTVLEDDRVRQKLVHGSDWPIISLPPVRQMGIIPASEMMLEGNWMKRDVLTKKRLGLGQDYWERAATLLRRT